MSTRTLRSSKRFVAMASAVAVAASGLAISSNAGADFDLAANPDQVRLAGPDRYATSAIIAGTMASVYCITDAEENPLEGFGASLANDSQQLDVILASGANFPDGLAASALAAFTYVLNNEAAVPGPVLLTPPGGLSPFTTAALDFIDETCNTDSETFGGLGDVTIVGGTAAVSNQVVLDLINRGVIPERIAGENRYETALEIADEIGASSGPFQAILATGSDFADALSAGSFAAATGAPVLLNDGMSLRDDVADWLDDELGGQGTIAVMGGTAAVPASVTNELIAAGYIVQRFAGSNRYETATLFADATFTPPPLGNVMLVSGENFADALSAGPLAGFAAAPMLLTRQASLPAVTAEYITDNTDPITTVWVAGGSAAIADSVVAAAQAAAQADVPVVTGATIEWANQTLATATLDLDDSSINFTARAAALPGALGNDRDITVTYTAGTPTAVSVSVDADAEEFTIAVTGNAPYSQVVTAWNNSAAGNFFIASANFPGDEIDSSDDGEMATSGGGETTATVVATFNTDVAIAAVDEGAVSSATSVRTAADADLLTNPDIDVDDSVVTFTFEDVSDRDSLEETLPPGSFLRITAAGGALISNADFPSVTAGATLQSLVLAD